MKILSCGAEVELPVVYKTDGKSAAAFSMVDDICSGSFQNETVRKSVFSCKQGLAVIGYDNGYNNAELSVGPFSDSGCGLRDLNKEINSALNNVLSVLDDKGMAVLNIAEHPLQECSEEAYQRFRLRRPIYDYWNKFRNWKHCTGINAKAQTSPCTGIKPEDSLDALNIVMAFSPVFIAVYGNSAFGNGLPTGYCADRLNMWNRMFSQTYFESDLKTCRFPQKPFDSLLEYFRWMMGDGTVMHAVQKMPSHFKENNSLYVIPENPCVFDFLRQKRWKANELYTGEEIEITPQAFHAEYHQFAQFSDARIRYGFKQDIPADRFIKAIDAGAAEFASFFISNCDYSYIEGRVPCTNLPSKDMTQRVADSVIISSSALQKGLLQNHEEAFELIRSTGWKNIAGLRKGAVIDGMNAAFGGISIRNLCEKALDIASEGLNSEEKQMLAYPESVIDSGMNSAQKALKIFSGSGGTVHERIQNILMSRICRDIIPVHPVNR
ncbi:MAG: glutamate-cysteine ligase family protein [Deferribacterales bacterium]